jgi:DNA polymerase I
MVNVPDGFDVRGRVLEDGELAAWLAEHSLGNRFGVAVHGTGRGYGLRAAALAIVAADGDGRYLDAAALADDDEAALSSWLADPGPPKAVHDLKSSMHALSGRGWTLRGVTSDTASAGYLLRPDRPGQSLNDLLIHHMRCALPGAENPESFEPQHLILRACAVLDLADVLDEELARIDSSALLGRIELPVSQALAEMETTGIAVDPAASAVEGLLDSVAQDGRIHTTFQIEAGTGRISSSNPVLPTDRRVRDAFVAGEGYAELLTAGYVDLESRIVDQVSGAASLRAAVEEARRAGYCSTLLGRRRYLTERDDDDAALSTLLQGSAADIAKAAMVSVGTTIRGVGMRSRLLVQLNGEMVFEVAEGERDALAAHVREQMDGAHPLDGPLDIEIGCGSSWAAAAG